MFGFYILTFGLLLLMESLDTDLTAPGALRRHLHGGHQAVHVVAPAHTSHVITEFFIKVQSLLVAKERSVRKLHCE